MAYMISTATNIHWVQRVEARSNTPGVFTLSFWGNPAASDEQNNCAEVTVFTEDQALVDRLVAAINGAAQ